MLTIPKKTFPIFFRFTYLAHYIGLFSLFFTSFNIYSQHPSHRHFTTDDGLASNEVYKIIEDRNGYIWMATDRGVVKYDGYNFEIFTTEDGLNDNVVFWIYEDNNGRMWFTFLDKTIGYYDAGVFSTHPATEKLKEYNIRLIYSLYVDEKDIVWLGVYGEYPILKMYPNGSVEKVPFDRVETSDIIILKMDNNNTLYGRKICASDSSLQNNVRIYNKQGHLETKFILPYPVGSFSAQIFNDTVYVATGTNLYKAADTNVTFVSTPDANFTISLYKDNENSIWAGSNFGGVFQFSTGDKQILERELLSEVSISSICQDREGGYWFSSNIEGVFYFPSIKIQTIESINESIRKVRHNGTSIWVATSNGSIYEIMLSGSEYEVKKHLEKRQYVTCIYGDLIGQVWITIDNGDPIFNEQFDFPRDGILGFREVVQQPDSSYWVNTFYQTTKRAWPSMRTIDSVRFPTKYRGTSPPVVMGNDWLLYGSASGLWELKDGAIKRHKHHKTLLETRINDLQILANNSIVMTTLGEGMIHLDKNGKTCQVLKKDGLPSNLLNCSYTLPGDSVTWVGSSLGLTKIEWSLYPREKFHISHFTIFNGLNSNEIMDIDYVNGQLLVGSAKGLMIINGNHSMPIESEPLIHEKSIEVNYEARNVDDLEIEHNDLIKFYFTGVSMSSNSKLSYQYRMKGFDENWESTTNRFLEFRSLAPGDYELEVYSVNANGAKSKKPIITNFSVLPAFWETWWFRIGTVLLFVGIIFILFNWRFRIKRRESLLLSQSLQAEQEALSSQITPHFLFNALNSIQNLVQNQKSKIAVVNLSNFAWLMRRILHNVKLHSVLLSNEIETLKLYLDLEVLRLENKFSYSIVCEEEINIDFVRIPPMIIQPFIENSIWHGILNKPNQKGVVSITFRINGDQLIIEITDDGVGRDFAKKMKVRNSPFEESVGLDSVQRRMELLSNIHKTKLKYEIIDLFDSEDAPIGTKVLITIPLDYV